MRKLHKYFAFLVSFVFFCIFVIFYKLQIFIAIFSDFENVWFRRGGCHYEWVLLKNLVQNSRRTWLEKESCIKEVVLQYFLLRILLLSMWFWAERGGRGITVLFLMLIIRVLKIGVVNFQLSTFRILLIASILQIPSFASLRRKKYSWKLSSWIEFSAARKINYHNIRLNKYFAWFSWFSRGRRRGFHLNDHRDRRICWNFLRLDVLKHCTCEIEFSPSFSYSDWEKLINLKSSIYY